MQLTYEIDRLVDEEDMELGAAIAKAVTDASHHEEYFDVQARIHHAVR